MGNITKGPTFSRVVLGKHEEALRKMLLDQDAGAANKYRIFGHTVLHHVSHKPIQIITQPQRFKMLGGAYYGMMYGGVQWTFKMSSIPDRQHDENSLRSTGEMPLIGVDWRRFYIIQKAGSVLRGELCP